MMKVVAKNIEIECLRAVAILFVIVHHLPVLFSGQSVFPGWLENNFGFWTGVDLFFVISGFLITRSLASLHERDASRALIIKSYLVRRVFRLLPAAFTWIFISLFLSLLLPDNPFYPDISTLWNDALAAFFHYSNVYYAYCFANQKVNVLCSAPAPLAPYWSLALEEQFYLLLPLAMLVFSRRLLVCLCVSVVCVGFFWHRPIFSYAWYSRVDGLLWGVILAYATGHGIRRLLIMRYWRVGGFLLLLTVIAYLAKEGGASIAGLQATWTPAIGFASLACAVLVFLASYDRGLTLVYGCFQSLLALIGSRSYSLYLCHMPLFCATAATVDWLTVPDYFRPFAAMCLGLGAMALGGELTYRCIESPARDAGKRLAARLFPSVALQRVKTALVHTGAAEDSGNYR